MGENTGIAWATHTFNPWIGCTKVGPGCVNCYAEVWDQRFSDGVHWGAGSQRRRTAVQNWNKVRKWDREAAASGTRPRVFCASLADVFDNEVPDEWREDLWQLIAETPNLDWILVTKRVGNVRKMKPDGGFPRNVILLATIVNQDEADRDMPKLVAALLTGAVQNIGVSYEPALGPVDWSPWIAEIDWLIVGGESSQGGAVAREFPINWAYCAIMDARGTSCAVFIKQVGSSPRGFSPFDYVEINDRAGADPSEWPEDLRVRQFPVIGGGQ